MHFQVFAKLTALSRREGEGEESLDLTDHLRESNSGSWPVVEAAVRPLCRAHICHKYHKLYLWRKVCVEKNDKYEVCHFGDKKNLHGFHAELLPQALTEGDCERRVQGQYGVGI